MKNRILSIMLVAVMAISLASCGTSSKEDEKLPTPSETEEVTKVPEVKEQSSEKEKVTESTETAGTESTETESTEAPAYTITDLSTTMYASSTVNVRSGPSTDYEVVGSLSTNQEVSVTGKCNETGWYRISYNEGEAFVSDSYLSDEKVEVASSSDDGGNSDSNNNGNSGARYIKYGEIDEEWFAMHGWLYDASNDLIYPTDDKIAFFNQWEGKTIAEAEAEIGMGIAMTGPWGEMISLENYKNATIGSCHSIVFYNGHYIQMPF